MVISRYLQIFASRCFRFWDFEMFMQTLILGLHTYKKGAWFPTISTFAKMILNLADLQILNEHICKTIAWVNFIIGLTKQNMDNLYSATKLNFSLAFWQFSQWTDNNCRVWDTTRVLHKYFYFLWTCLTFKNESP